MSIVLVLTFPMKLIYANVHQGVIILRDGHIGAIEDGSCGKIDIYYIF